MVQLSLKLTIPGHRLANFRVVDIPFWRRLLYFLYESARTRFYQPAWHRGLDPVITSEPEGIRFEGFSSCSSVYFSLFVRAFEDYDFVQRGSTNVELTPVFVKSLRSPATFSVASGGFSRESEGQSLFLPRVPLPARWQSGFVQVRAELMQLQNYDERKHWTTRQARLSLSGDKRLRLVQPLLADVQGLTTVHSHQSSYWHFELPQVDLELLLTPEVSRGFSGEGEALRFAQSTATEHFQPEAGFNALTGKPFSRDFSPPLTSDLPRRFQAAVKLCNTGDIQLLNTEPVGKDFSCSAHIAGQRGTYTTTITVQNGYLLQGTCTCPWGLRHGLQRGPCKHMLALRFAQEKRNGVTP